MSISHKVLKRIGLIVMNPAFRKSWQNLAFFLPLLAMAIAMYILLGFSLRESSDTHLEHFQRAINELIELRTDEVERFAALPDGTLVAIHGRADVVTQDLVDPEADIGGSGYLLERLHQALYDRQTTVVRTHRNTRTVTAGPSSSEWRSIESEFLPSQSWPAPTGHRFSFGPITSLPRRPGKRIALTPGPELQATLREAGFRSREDDCFVKPGSSSTKQPPYPADERICWHLYQAQEQSYYGAKDGSFLSNWSTDSGTVISQLTDTRIDPRTEWRNQIAQNEAWNSRPRTVQKFLTRELTRARVYLIALLSLAYGWLALAWFNRASEQPRKAPKRVLLGVLLGLSGPLLLFLFHGSAIVFFAFFVLWLFAPLLLWRLGKAA